MSNPCPEILQSAQLQLALGKGKRRKALWYKALFKLAHQINFQFTAAGSKRERERTQMQAIKSFLSLLTNCGPLHISLGVSTTKPELIEKLLLLNVAFYTGITSNLGACTLNTDMG